MGIEAGFDGACVDLGLSSEAAGTFSLYGEGHNPNDDWGVCFAKLTGVDTTTPTLRFYEADSYLGLPTVAYWSYTRDKDSWTSIAVTDQGTYRDCTLPTMTQDNVYVCYGFIPFCTVELEDWISENTSNSYLLEPRSAVLYGGNKYQIGAVPNSFIPVYAFRITDTTAKPAGGGQKLKAVVFGATHCGEMCGTWSAIRLMEYLLTSADAEAVRLRREFEFWVCPINTPDSRYYGYYRNTRLGDHNSNRDWDDAVHIDPEIQITRAACLADNGTSLVRVGLDLHGWQGGSVFNGYWGTDSTTYRAELDTYITPNSGTYGSQGVNWCGDWMSTVLNADHAHSPEIATEQAVLADMAEWGEGHAKTIDGLNEAAAFTAGPRIYSSQMRIDDTVSSIRMRIDDTVSSIQQRVEV